ncbi:MAG TPA: GNAT family N-acetyltransferase, partial [Pyrinomonadaceae bacterium]|nr:GNAT family N-acetyltransferase [Pyrinomonadaceae bacterium]
MFCKAQDEVTGYLHAQYSQSLSQFGTPRYLPESGSWIIERQIPDSQYFDASGCYPLFLCRDWSKLHVDLANVGNGLVCLSVVTDPFGEYDPAYLQECFPDVTMPFKEHFVIDLSRSPDTFVQSHHRRNTRKALQDIRVEKCENPIAYLDDWTTLYASLIERHAIKGIAAFSRKAFASQLRVPGIVVFRAEHHEATVGMLLWYGQGNRAYYHLGAYNSRGYELGASFALFDYSIRYFSEHGFAWLNLGSGAGIGDKSESGLSRFKQGWSTDIRTVYFCGRILDPDKYREICET